MNNVQLSIAIEAVHPTTYAPRWWMMTRWFVLARSGTDHAVGLNVAITIRLMRIQIRIVTFVIPRKGKSRWKSLIGIR